MVTSVTEPKLLTNIFIITHNRGWKKHGIVAHAFGKINERTEGKKINMTLSHRNAPINEGVCGRINMPITI